MRSKQYDILLMEDDAEDRLIMGDAFAELGYENNVTMYDSSIAFLQEMGDLNRLSPPPLMIVLDYNLPGSSGLEVLQQLKKDEGLRRIEVVMYSTSMSPKLQQECKDTGAEQCYEKGGTYGEVLFFVKQLCNHVYSQNGTEGRAQHGTGL